MAVKPDVAAAAPETVIINNETIELPQIPQTSVAARGTQPGEVTVQFRRWHAHGLTAYQRGQFAGFPAAVAIELERQGVVFLGPGQAREAASRMIRK